MSPARAAAAPAGARAPVLAVLLFLLTAAVFWPATGNDFIRYDDDAYVTANVWVREGLSPAGVHWAFTTFHESNWHPLTWLSHMLDVSLFGVRPFGHHLTSVLLHALNASLLFVFLSRASGALWRSAAAAALFALHPLRVESVAWVAERKDVLGATFWMLSLLAYAAYARRPGRRRYLVLAMCFGLGLLSKPMTLTLPLALLLLDLWPLGRWRPRRTTDAGWWRELGRGLRPLMLEKFPLLLLTVLSALVTLRAQQVEGTIGTLEVYPLAVRVANALTAVTAYLGATFRPLDLAVIYPHPRALPPAWQVLGSLALLALISLAALSSARRRPWLALGWLWFLGVLVPVVGLVQVGLQSRADRYTYLPHVGIAVALCWGVAELLRRRGPAILAPFLIVALLAALAGATRSQIAWWRDDTMLLEHAIAVTQDNWVAHLTLATNLEKQGHSAEARPHYEAMARIKRDFARAHAGRGIRLAGAGAGSAADAPAAEGTAAPAREAYLSGNELVRQGRHREAVAAFAAALRLAPLDAQAHNNLGVALAGLGDRGGAAAEFREAAHLLPGAVEPVVNLGNVLASQGQIAAAVASYGRAVELHPDHVVARLNLADALLAGGRRYRALFEYREALRIDPEHREARRRYEGARASSAPAPALPSPVASTTDFLLFF